MFVISGVLPDTVGTFTCNILRKATSTALHEMNPQLDEIISQSMSHSLSTAQRHYRRSDTVRNNAYAQVFVHNYWSSSSELQQQPEVQLHQQHEQHLQQQLQQHHQQLPQGQPEEQQHAAQPEEQQHQVQPEERQHQDQPQYCILESQEIRHVGTGNG